MKDLTVQQAVKQLRQIFPTRTCFAGWEAYSYDHLIQTHPIEPYKTIYVSHIPELNHISGNSFRILLRVAKVVKEALYGDC